MAKWEREISFSGPVSMSESVSLVSDNFQMTITISKLKTAR